MILTDYWYPSQFWNYDSRAWVWVQRHYIISMIKLHICLVLLIDQRTPVRWAGVLSVSVNVSRRAESPHPSHIVSIFLESLRSFAGQIWQARQLLRAWKGLTGRRWVGAGRQISGLKQQLNIKISSSAQTAQLYSQYYPPPASQACLSNCQRETLSSSFSDLK